MERFGQSSGRFRFAEDPDDELTVDDAELALGSRLAVLGAREFTDKATRRDGRQQGFGFRAVLRRYAFAGAALQRGILAPM